MKNDRTFQLLLAAVLIFLLSLLLPPFSVHTYCENRRVAGVFGISAAIVFFICLRNPGLKIRKISSGIVLALCLLAIWIDVAFIIYATHLCRHMFDQLH